MTAFEKTFYDELALFLGAMGYIPAKDDDDLKFFLRLRERLEQVRVKDKIEKNER